ncbi:MAG: radical SAM protein [Hadesarchaea archaeon]|nr:MAG: radical SAM protein [Hadesarchaea archaeon]TDA32478.1 MAG: radical SAM protein [Hadesarchaea archaeon]
MRRLKDMELGKTTSLCPECLKLLQATLYEREGKVWMKKTCPEHGEFEEIYSGSYEWYKRAEKYAMDGRGIENPQVTKEEPSCPQDCGLCRLHLSHTALANVVLTNRCDLVCFYCFFYAQRMGYVYEPTLEQIEQMFRVLKEERPIACNAVQFTGGEPCLREDLVEIVRLAKSYDFDHIQLNTNGIRLAHNPELVGKIREAGVNTLYLSFDGVSEKTNPKNHWEFPLTLEHCRKVGLGIVLVPTIIKGVNDHEVGEMVKYAFKNLDIVRSVNFQPISLVGRMPRNERSRYRITIPEVIERLEEQTNGEITLEDFFPVPTAMVISRFIEELTGKPSYDLSSHFACGAATYVFKEDGRMIPITRFVDVEGFLEYLKEKTEELRKGKSKTLIKLKLLTSMGKFIDSGKKPKDLKLGRLLYHLLIRRDYGALGRFHLKSLFIGMMHFMDLYNYDVERVKRCCIHYVMSDNRIVPFCAFNVIPEWYRDKDQESQGIPIEEWERRTGKKLKDDLYKRDVEKLKRTEAYRKFEQDLREIRSGLY